MISFKSIFSRIIFLHVAFMLLLLYSTAGVRSAMPEISHARHLLLRLRLRCT
jgi:hypothetical protein